MYSKLYSGLALGIDGMLITVESDVSVGMPGLFMVGYLASSVKEAGERVRTALKNVGYSFPSKRITVNLSPADVRKEGSGFDLAIAVSILISMGDIPINQSFNKKLSETLFLGELGLDGEVLSVPGVLPIVDHAAAQGIKRVILPRKNAVEAAYIKDIDIIPVENLMDVICMLGQNGFFESFKSPEMSFAVKDGFEFDLADIRGQEMMKRGVIIAVSGFHNILLTGAAGSGKSMVAKCIPELMPPLSYEESLELTKIYSIAGMLDLSEGLIRERPFRSPGQNVSEAALIGGGRNPKPGEITLATGGVLFLDEFPEFQRSVIEGLRQPMEDRKVTVSRVKASYTFPARFMLVSARNNCPCGFYPDRKRCRCSATEIYHYQNKISHPIMDRIDIRLEIKPVGYNELFGKAEGLSSADAKQMIEVARERQESRYKNESFRFNSEIPQGRIEDYIKLGNEETELMRRVYESSEISARGYYKVLRLARTIADIDDREEINVRDIEEATFFRNESDGVYIPEV